MRVLYVETTLSPGSTSRPLDSKTGTPFLRLKSARADPEWPTTTPCPSTRSRARGFESRALVFGDVLCTSMMELPPQRDWHSSATFGGGPPRPRGLSSGCLRLDITCHSGTAAPGPRAARTTHTALVQATPVDAPPSIGRVVPGAAQRVGLLQCNPMTKFFDTPALGGWGGVGIWATVPRTGPSPPGVPDLTWPQRAGAYAIVFGVSLGEFPVVHHFPGENTPRFASVAPALQVPRALAALGAQPPPSPDHPPRTSRRRWGRVLFIDPAGADGAPCVCDKSALPGFTDFGKELVI